MSSLLTARGPVHYQVLGRGAPVLLIHGWLGSWDLWLPTMRALAERNRCYAVDLYGFGESGKRQETARVDTYIDMVPVFLDALGIDRATVIGHSMGGTTALGAAIRYPERVARVGVIGSPIVGSSLALLLKLASVPWIGRLVRQNVGLLALGMRLYAPLVTRAPSLWYPMVSRDIKRTTIESFFASIRSLRHTDLRPRLTEVKMPALGVYGLRDVIVHPRQHALMSAGIAHAQVKTLPGSGHFPMLDEPAMFDRLIRDFVTA
ncbi:MAG TPA: alpha/beta fold hydrolase [Anaerolineales bacterium]|nr:alpha/beta fold hydrolase [Anaerolineales bacterium]